MKLDPSSLCPCQSGALYKECCGVFLEGRGLPETPLKLMRSRYTAFTLANMDYLESTMKGIPFEKEATFQFAESVDWKGLKIISHAKIGNVGEVEFEALFSQDGVLSKIHERSTFTKENGKWFYTGYKHLN